MSFHNQSVMSHDFSMVPRSDVPRSSFRRDNAYKTTFDAGYLIPVYFDEVMPGDSANVRMSAIARLATPIFPLMDNMYLDSFFFFVPMRLLWTNFKKFMGEQANPGDSISYLVPQVQTPVGGYTSGTLQDYFGLPCNSELGANQKYHNAWWTRAYNFVWNEWFRDQNLQNSVTFDTGDGPDTYSNYVLLRRGKRHDYFTSCLPWPQKGNTAVTLPLGTSAPVKSNATFGTPGGDLSIQDASGNYKKMGSDASFLYAHSNAGTSGNSLFADLSNATAATINAIRLAFQTQRLLERDARGGTRYVEMVKSHFGVIVPDYRVQRPEYLGGGTSPVNISPIAQTSQTATTPLGTLAATGTMISHGHGFTKSFTEHGVLLGLISVRADLTYQRGLHKMWTRQTRYDYYWPELAMLGEQAVLNQEIYCDGSGNDTSVFGYQEHWAEYRYKPSRITGQFRSTYSTPLDAWHLSQKFTSLPTLGSTFIQDTPPVSRVVAVGSGANGAQFILDAFFSETWARPMPMYSVPGMIDHF